MAGGGRAFSSTFLAVSLAPRAGTDPRGLQTPTSERQIKKALSVNKTRPSFPRAGEGRRSPPGERRGKSTACPRRREEREEGSCGIQSHHGSGGEIPVRSVKQRQGSKEKDSSFPKTPPSPAAGPWPLHGSLSAVAPPSAINCSPGKAGGPCSFADKAAASCIRAKSVVVGQELALVLHGVQAWLHDLPSLMCPEPSPYKARLTHGWSVPCRLLQMSPTCVSSFPSCVTTLTCPTRTVPVWFYTGVQMGMDRWSFSKQRIY